MTEIAVDDLRLGSADGIMDPVTITLVERARVPLSAIVGSRSVSILASLRSVRLHVQTSRRIDPFELVEGRNGEVEVRTGPWVGVAEYQGLRVVIEPKVRELTASNLFFLLHGFPRDGRFEDVLRVRPESPGIEVAIEEIFADFCNHAMSALRQGLPQTSVSRRGSPMTIRGRVLLSKQISRRGLLLPLDCEWAEKSLDSPANRLIRSAAALVARLSGRPDSRSLGGRIVKGVIGVGEPRFDDLSNARLPQLPRYSPAYRAALELAQVILLQLTPGLRSGRNLFPAFFVNMDDVFQQYVTRVLRSRFGTRVDSTSVYSAEGSIPVRDLRVIPDVVLWADASRTKVAAVIDVKNKYSRILEGARDWAPSVDDVYQTAFYASRLGTRHVLLVYPGISAASGLRRTIAIEHTSGLSLSIECWAIPVTGHAADLALGQSHLTDRLSSGYL